MGFSDIATYIRASNRDAVQEELTTILGAFGFLPCSPTAAPVAFHFDVPSLEATSILHIWTVRASEEFTRLYTSHPSLFLIHKEDFVPLLERLAGALQTDAFELSVYDGDSCALLETDGTQSRLTGFHSYVLDELYDRSPDMNFSPGDVFSLRGVPLPFDDLVINARLVPELLSYDLDGFVDTVIIGLEIALGGRELPDYYAFLKSPPDTIQHSVFAFEKDG